MPTDKTAEPKSQCARCKKVDNHPKHIVRVGMVEAFGRVVRHPDDIAESGTLRYHFDCEHDWQHLLDPDHVAAAQSGTHGDALRALIVGGK